MDRIRLCDSLTHSREIDGLHMTIRSISPTLASSSSTTTTMSTSTGPLCTTICSSGTRPIVGRSHSEIRGKRSQYSALNQLLRMLYGEVAVVV